MATTGISGFYLLKLVLALLLVLGIFLFLARIVRRLNSFPPKSSGPLAVLAGISVGSRERIVIVRAGEDQLLLGISPSGIVKLQKFDKPIDTQSVTTAGDFQASLNSFLPDQKR